MNTLKNRKNLYLDLEKKDILQKLDPLMRGGGYMLDPMTGKVKPKIGSLGWDVPWVHWKHDTRSRCDVCHKILFNVLEVMPTWCLQCWKVVVRPKTVLDLFNLYELQKYYDEPSKCGIELRDTVHGNYGGYFYNRSREQGQKCYEDVKALIPKFLVDPETPIILKRACTEFEFKFGPSDKWDEDHALKGDDKDFEDYLTHYIDAPYIRNQPEFLVARVMRRWLHHAYSIGDVTYKEFTDGEPLSPSYVTYHEEERKDGEISRGCGTGCRSECNCDVN